MSRIQQWTHDGNICLGKVSLSGYLTALALIREEDVVGRLVEAAASERFANDESAFLIESGSELFQMCIAIHEPRSDLTNKIETALRSYVEAHAGAFSVDWVVESSKVVVPGVDPRMAGSDAMLRAVEYFKLNEDLVDRRVASNACRGCVSARYGEITGG